MVGLRETIASQLAASRTALGADNERLEQRFEVALGGAHERAERSLDERFARAANALSNELEASRAEVF